MQHIIFAIILMLVLDSAWLWIMLPVYQRATELVQKEALNVSFPAVVGAYVCMAIGLILLVFPIALAQKSVWVAAGYGALYGFVLYGTYDMTCKAILSNFSWEIAAIDMVWGTLLMGTVTGLSFIISQ